MTTRNCRKIADNTRDTHQIDFLNLWILDLCSELALKRLLPTSVQRFWTNFNFLWYILPKIRSEKVKFLNSIHNRWKLLGRDLFQRWFRIWIQKIDLMCIMCVIGDFLKISRCHDFWVNPYTLRSSFPPQKLSFH